MKLTVKNLLLSYAILQSFVNICEAVQTTLSKPVVNSPGVLNRSVFTIVRFLNIPCASPNGQMSGVCFSLNDCARLQGTQIGTCASGFGVCCILYIDVDNSIGPIHLTVNTKGIGKRKWNIRTSYIECNNPSRAPPNCIQYYTGLEGRFSSFNTGGYLNNMDYAICFRKEVGRCSITYTADNIESFIILNLEPNNSPTVGSGEAGLGIDECPMDYLRLAGDRYCGARLNPSNSQSNPTNNAPVTDNSTGPFTAYFRTDSSNTAVGFNLQYNQNSCG